MFKQGKVTRGLQVAKLVFSAPMAWKIMRDCVQELRLTYDSPVVSSEIPLPSTDLEKLLDDILLESQPRTYDAKPLTHVSSNA